MTQEQQFTKGFNNGYLLAKHEPELIKKLLITKNENNEYFKGIVSGKKEHDIEKMRLRLNTVSKSKAPQRGITIKGKER